MGRSGIIRVQAVRKPSIRGHRSGTVRHREWNMWMYNVLNVLKARGSVLARGCLSLIIIFSGLAAVGDPTTAYADANPVPGPSPLEVTETGDAVAVQWRVPDGSVGAASGRTYLNAHPYGRYVLPMQLFAVQIDGNVLPSAVPTTLDDIPWTGQLEQAPDLLPPALDWKPAPWLEPDPEPEIPQQPLFLLRIRTRPRPTVRRLRV